MQIFDVRIVVLHGEAGLTEATHVVTNDVIVLGKVRELVIPHAGIQRKAVYENQRKSVARHYLPTLVTRESKRSGCVD